MNYLGFSTIDAIIGFLTLLFMGIFFGFLLGLIRFTLFNFMQGRVPDFGKGVK